MLSTAGFAHAHVASDSTGQLKNGLLVVTDTHDAEGDPPDAVWFVLSRGSADQRADERGAAMIAARALVLALESQGVDASGVFGTTWDAVRSGAGVSIAVEHTTLEMRVGRGGDLASALDAARVMLDGFAPDDDLVERARALVLEQSDDRAERSYELELRADWMVELFGGGPMGRIAFASRADLESVSADAVRAYIDRCWRVEHAAVLVSGPRTHDGVLESARAGLGGVEARGPTPRERVFERSQIEGRRVTRASDRLDADVLAMIWFDDAFGDKDHDARARALLALAGESARARLSERLAGSSDSGTVDAVAQFGIIAEGVSFAQTIVRLGGGGNWADAFERLTLESESLRVSGVDQDGFDRAREIVTRQFRAQLDGYELGDPLTRAQLRSYFLVSGEKGLDPSVWISEMIDAVDRVTLEDVNGELARMMSIHDPGVVVLTLGGTAPDPDRVGRIVASALDRLAQRGRVLIEREAVPTILDFSPKAGEIEEIRVHRGSGIVSGRIGNGVWAHHHEVPGSGRVRVSVHAGFGGPDAGVVSGVGSRVFTAMRDARLSRRLDDETRAFMDAHAIVHQVEMSASGLTIHAEGDSGSLREITQFIFALLSDVRLDREGSVGSSLVGSMELGVARAFGVGIDPGAAPASPSVWWRERMRSSSFGIGVCGDIDPERALERVAESFGSLPQTHEHEGDGASDPAIENGVRRAVVRDPSGGAAVVAGFTACGSTDSEQTRALVLGGLVLGERLAAAGIGSSSYASALVLPALDERALVLARVECAVEELDSVEDALIDQIAACADLEMQRDEVERARARILSAIDAMVETRGFWSSRLARLHETGLRVDDVWSIREDYASMDAARVNAVFRRWHDEGVPYVVRIVPE